MRLRGTEICSRGAAAVALTLLVVASATAAGVGATAVGVASAAPTGVDDCTTIDDSGVYELTANVTNPAGGGSCLAITADDVAVDGNGHTIQTGGTGIEATGVDNVTVRDVTATGTVGVRYRDVTDGLVADVSADGRIALVVAGGENVAVRDSDLTGGAGLAFSADDGTVADNRVGETTYGVSVTGNDTTVRDNRVVGALGIHGGNADSLFVSGRDNLVVGNVVTGGQVDRLVVAGTNTTVRDNRVRGVGNGSDYFDSRDGLVVAGTNHTVVANDASRNRDAGIVVSGAGHTVHDNVAVENGVGVDLNSRDSLIYDNRLHGADAAVVSLQYRTTDPDRPPFAYEYRSNEWNVSARSGTNVVGGPTVGGNYYAESNGTGFSEACADGNDDGVCDSPNALAPNNTDHLPLAGDANASVGYVEVYGFDVPAQFTENEGATVTANVTNVGTERATQTVVLAGNFVYENRFEDETVDRTVTLAPGETTTLTFDVSYDRTWDRTALTATSANASLSQSVAVAEAGGSGGDGEGNATNYQVDFVAGHPIENLSADRLYAREDRLFRFAFGNGEEGITDHGFAWANESLRTCVDPGRINGVDDGDAARVTFTVNDACGDVTLSLAAYSMPGESFSVETAAQQELLNATTATFGPGEHTVTVDLPDADDGNATD